MKVIRKTFYELYCFHRTYTIFIINNIYYFSIHGNIRKHTFGATFLHFCSVVLQNFSRRKWNKLVNRHPSFINDENRTYQLPFWLRTGLLPPALYRYFSYSVSFYFRTNWTPDSEQSKVMYFFFRLKFQLMCLTLNRNTRCFFPPKELKSVLSCFKN